MYSYVIIILIFNPPAYLRFQIIVLLLHAVS